MSRIRILLTSAMTLALLSGPSWAEEKGQGVSLRAGVHDGYTRLVFAGAAPIAYHAKEDGQSLILSFDKPDKVVVSGAPPQGLPRVQGYQALGLGEVKIDFARGNHVRHFVVGNRLIVDIQGADPAAASAAASPATTAASPAQIEPAAAAATPKTKLESKPKSPTPGRTALPKTGSGAVTGTTSPAPPVAAAPSPSAVAPAVPPSAAASSSAPSSPPDADHKSAAVVPTAEDYRIDVTSTRSIGLAAFERFGWLWVVVDAPDYRLIPQLSGPHKEKFTPFETVPLNEATAFRTRIPKGFSVRGDGGGLIWKLHVADVFPDAGAKAVDFSRPVTETESGNMTNLKWMGASSRRVVDLLDPEAGDVVKVVTVETAADFSGKPQDFVEVSSLPAAVGAAFVLKADDVKVSKVQDGVLISREGGLTVSDDKDVLALKNKADASGSDKQKPDVVAKPSAGGVAPGASATAAAPFTSVFNFQDWQMGPIDKLSENQRILMTGLGGDSDQKKAEDLMTLAKLVLSHGEGPEALGYLDFALQFVPDLVSNPEFLAIRGAAEALSGKTDRAHVDLGQPALDSISEVKYWRAYVLSQLEDWKQAGDSLPDDMSFLDNYPLAVRAPFGLALAEISLRAGNTDKADKIMDKIAKDEPQLSLGYKSALDYLRGESARQKGDILGAKNKWEPLSTGHDHLYRAKAGLALTTLQLDRKEIKPDKAIDNLEGLRYAWRGDELEMAINAKLGNIYIANGDPMKGMALLRLASSLAPGSDQGKKIAAQMADTFRRIFTTDEIKKLDPIDAVTLYDEYADLAPSGDDGDRLARNLAERLVDADLLPRAENILQNQVDNRLQELEGAAVALRLASIQLLDSKPDKALDTLSKASDFLQKVPPDKAVDDRRQIELLRARALADLKKPEAAFAALSLLPQDRDILRLRADIAWKAKRWQDAADALELIVAADNVSLTRPLTDDEAANILNWAVALYLADNRSVLANLRERYGDAMSQTKLAQKFEVVTRPRQNTLLADRGTINNIVAETDIFKNFLDSFKSDNIPTSPKKPGSDGKAAVPVSPTSSPTPPASSPASSSASSAPTPAAAGSASDSKSVTIKGAVPAEPKNGTVPPAKNQADIKLPGSDNSLLRTDMVPSD